jgi:hypothetical protein
MNSIEVKVSPVSWQVIYASVRVDGKSREVTITGVKI